MKGLELSCEGVTHTGLLRKENEDTFATIPELGLFAVFDGMGGHSAGDVASASARDLIVGVCRERSSEPATEVLDAALTSASLAIYEQAKKRRDRHGMGTTAIVARVEGKKATLAHVGDSRAYLLRSTRLQQLTADHTVVAAMLNAGAITPEEALHHPYKNVLSRCLGNQREVQVDVDEVELEQGDRLLLCSDGLSSFASHEAIEQVLRGAEDASAAAADLIELALKGGGGDNVTVVVIFAGAEEIPNATVVLRESGAHEWWRRREQFKKEARHLGLASSPICSKLAPNEAVELIAGSLAEAIFHDLEQSTGIHSWTFAENLAAGWLQRGGDYTVLRDLLDLLRDATRAVVADVASSNSSFANLLEIEVVRALIVVESAVAGVIAGRLRDLERELMFTHEEQFKPRVSTEQPTVPFLGGPRTNPPSSEVVALMDVVLSDVLAQLGAEEASLVARSWAREAHQLARQSSGGVEVLQSARELYGEHDEGTMSLFEALSTARAVHLRCTRHADIDVELKASGVRRIAAGYQSLAHAIGILVVDAGRPITDQLKEMAEHTARLREQVRRGEGRLAVLEAEFGGTTIVEES